MTSVERRLSELEQRIAELESTRWAWGARARRVEPDADAPFGMSWLNGLGAALVLAGVVSATAWLNERGYLTPALRNAVLLAGAGAVFAAGVRALHSTCEGRRRFGNGLTAVGALGLYVVPFAASKVDGLLGAEVAASIAVALTVGLAVAAWRWGFEVVAELAALGGLAVPLIAARGAPAWMPLVAYLAVYGAGLLWLHRVTGWASVSVIAAVGSAAFYLVVGFDELATAAIAAACIAPFALPYLLSRFRGRVPGLAEHVAAAVAAVTAAAVCYRTGSLLAAGGVGAVTFALALSVRSPLLAVLGALTLALCAGLAAPSSSLMWLGAGIGGALASVAIGLAWASESARRTGLVVLGATLVRMLTVDVWALSAGPRVIALLLLGAGLLAASFLYARYTDRVARQVDSEA